MGIDVELAALSIVAGAVLNFEKHAKWIGSNTEVAAIVDSRSTTDIVRLGSKCLANQISLFPSRFCSLEF